jgi:hypothetical protein
LAASISDDDALVADEDPAAKECRQQRQRSSLNRNASALAQSSIVEDENDDSMIKRHVPVTVVDCQDARIHH